MTDKKYHFESAQNDNPQDASNSGLTDDDFLSQNDNPSESTVADGAQRLSVTGERSELFGKKPRYGQPHFPKDPETGACVTKSGKLVASAGSGPIVKTKIIPPVDMQELVDKGIAPTLYANWDPKDPDSNWMLGYRKFTPERKQTYLTMLEQHGIHGVAARWAGVSLRTVHTHRKEDPAFDEACKDAEDYYHALTAASLLNQARVGQIDERYDKEGNLLSRRVSYEQQMRILMLKRAAPEYNDVQKQEVSVVGGAVVVPAPLDTTENWDDVVKKYTGASTGDSVGKSEPIDTSGSEVSEK